jgi:hypothetical protein
VIEIDAELGPVKRCPKCHEWWPADREFFYAGHTKSGLQSWCIACWSEYINAPERREHRLAYGRAWQERKRAKA